MQDTIFRKVFGTIIFLVVWPFIVQDIRYFPIGRPAAALLGATLMVVFTVAPQEQVFRILGDKGNIQTICLLVGMMALSYYYDREGLLHIVTLWIFGKRKPFRHVLWKVCILTATLSALITNDATCVVMTPLLLAEHTDQKRDKKEIVPLLMSIATSANIGSASTFFGNPQNAYIASTAGLSLLIFFITSLPAAIIGLAINTSLLYAIYYKVIFGSRESNVERENRREGESVLTSSIAEERLETSIQFDNSRDPFRGSDIAAHRNVAHNAPHSKTVTLHDSEGEQSKLSQKHRENVFSASLPNLGHYSDQAITRRNVFLSQNSISQCGNDRSTKEIKKRSWNRKAFVVLLIIITTVLIGLLAVPPQQHIEFNLGLLPFGAAVFTMLADTILNCKHARKVMIEIDWPVILMFYGLFVWLAGFTNTYLPSKALDEIQKYMDLSTVGGVLLFTVFVILGSNILSNVPLVILLIGRLDAFNCGKEDCSQLVGVLLAWVSTIAGNFTLIGSIANLIVAEKARSCIGHNLTFLTYLKFGFLSTFIVLFTGLPIVYFAANYVNLKL